MMRAAIFLALAFPSALAMSTKNQFMGKLEVTEKLSGNPIRKVVVMLQNMQSKVTEEGQKEQQMFDRFMCYCKSSDGELAGSIAAGENKVSELGTSVKAHTAQKAQLEQELRDDKASRAEADAAMKSATVLREKEAAAYAKDSAMLKTNIDALSGAIAAVSKGVSGAFLQTGLAATLKKIVIDASMEDADRQDVMAFLSAKDGSTYVPQSGQIIGVLKSLKDGMEKTLADATAEETSSIKEHDGLISAKTKQVHALQKAVEEKSKRVGELAVTISMEENDRDDTSEAVSQDKSFLADLSKNCDTKKAEWAEIVETRSAEMVAIADTIKMLNSDEALELFKKTLPGASFIQLEASADNMRRKALAIIVKAQRSAKPNGLSLDFVELALHGKKKGFANVIKMIDDMVKQLKQDQADDDEKKEYCEKQFDESDDKKKTLDQSLADLETAMASAAEGIAATKAELEQLDDAVKALDKSVAEATEQRKAEHADYTELMGNDAAAKELLEFAKNRLNKFYRPGAFKPAPARQALVQDETSNGAAPPPAPEAPGPFKKKKDESDSVIAMLDQIVKDLDKEMQQSDVDEKDAQRQYEQMMKDSSKKRAQDSRLIMEKEGMKAELESDLQDSKAEKVSTVKSLMGLGDFVGGLHKECDWLLTNMEVRRQARTAEIDALGNAKGVLSGADLSLVQRSSLRAHK